MTKKKIIYGVSGGYGDILLHTPMMKEAMRRNPDAEILFVSSHLDMIERSFPATDYNAFRFQHILENQRFDGEMVLQIYNGHLYNPRVMISGKSRHIIDVIARLYLGDDEMESRDMVLDLPPMDDRKFAMLAGIQKLAAGRPTVAVSSMTAVRKLNDYHYVKTIYQKDLPVHVCEQITFRMPEVFFVQFGLTVERPVLGAFDCRGLTILDAIFMMQQLDTYLVPEGAYAHAMAALKRKGCVVWTGLNKDFYAHPKYQVIVESEPLECKPCNRPFGAFGDLDARGQAWTCPDPKCQYLITTDMVAAGVRQALEENQR
jgi:hypothetical protein